MIRPDEKEKVLNAMVALEGNPSWEIIRDWLRKRLGQIFIEQGVFSPDMARYPFNAGRNAEVKEIVNTIDKARETLESIRRTT